MEDLQSSMEESALRKTSVKGIAAFAGAVTAVAALGGLFNPGRGSTREWYGALEKSRLNPPDAIFGPVWTTLYVLIAISGYRAWQRSDGTARSRVLALWAAQLSLNAIWSPLFFGAKKPALALADLVLMLAAIALYTRESARVDKPAAWMMAPYLAWVTFAGFLNEEIVRLNRSIE